MTSFDDAFWEELDCIRAELNNGCFLFEVIGRIDGESREIQICYWDNIRAPNGSEFLGVRFVHPESPQVTYSRSSNPNDADVMGHIGETLGRMGYETYSWDAFKNVGSKFFTEKRELKARREKGESSAANAL